MLVSIIVPTRNRPQPLRAALGAIDLQSHRQFEVLVVDDGSSPDNAALNALTVEALGSEARYISLPGNERSGSGPAQARNVALRSARGELVAFCDDDDEWIDPSYLQCAVQAFREDDSLDLLFGNQETQVGRQVVEKQWLPQLASRLRLPEQPEGAMYSLNKADALIDHFPSMNICVFRRTVLEAVDGFWEDVRYCEDMDLYVRVVDIARRIMYRDQTVCIHHVPDPNARASASTRLAASEKDLAQIAVGHHLLGRCESRAARVYARRLAGFAYRRLALSGFKAGSPERAVAFARLGLAIWFTPRWAAYTMWVALRHALSNGTA